MKTSSVFSLVLILCYLCRAQKHSVDDDDILLQAPNVESGKEKAQEETAQTQSPGTDAEGREQEVVLQADIWAELRRLRDMVVAQEVQLEHLTGRVTAAESLVEALQRENTVQSAELAVAQQKLTVSEGRMDELKIQQEAQAAELAVAQQKLIVGEGRMDELKIQQEAQAAELAVAQQKLNTLQQRLTVSEGRVEELEKQQEAQAAELAVAQQKLTVSEGRVDELKIQQEAQAAELAVAQQKLTVSEGRVEELEKQQEVRKLAFSASLLTSGDGNTSSTEGFTPLIYKNVFTNIGNHYNAHTGFFTAPVRGVYYFRFTGHAAHSEHAMVMRLFKNAHFTVTAADRYTTDTDAEDNASNGVVLHLEVGDVVSVQLAGEVWDDHYHRTTFSGFLLFPL